MMTTGIVASRGSVLPLTAAGAPGPQAAPQ